jgi:hypothetical protein
MADKGIASSTSSPPLWQLLWSIGINLPPPLYMRFLSLALFSGTVFGIMFGTFAWFMGNKGARTMSLDEAGLVALATGALFGLIIAWFTRRLARKHGLGSWAAIGASSLRSL